MEKSNLNAETIVLGGGVVGLSVAVELAKNGVKTLLAFPMEGNITSATLAAGAMLGAFGEVTADDGPGEVEELEFRLAAQRQYPEWLADIEDRSQRKVHQGKGTFIIANNEGVCDRASINRMKAEADRLGEPTSWVEPDEVPGLKPSTAYAPSLCLHLKNENSVDSAQLVEALYASVKHLPEITHIDDAVVSVQPQGTVWIVTTRKGVVMSAPNVVLAAGSRSFEILSNELRDAAKLPELYFGKGVSLLVKSGPKIPQTIRTPNRAFACGIHVVPRGHSEHLYVGATNFLGTDHEQELGVQLGELHGLIDETVHQINTEIRTSRIDLIRTGFRPISSLRKPIVGETALKGLFVATGTYRNGILMAPRVAQIIADSLGVRRHGERVHNPFPVVNNSPAQEGWDLSRLSQIGIRDIIGFLQEPRGPLPFNRAGELETYVRALFEMSIMDEQRHVEMRNYMRARLNEAPFNETMHKLFYEIIDKVKDA